MRKHKLAACVGMRCRQQAAAFGADEGADQLALRKPHGRDPDGLVGCRGRGRATSPAEGWGERFGATQFRRVWLSQDFSNPPPLPPAPPRDTYLSLARLLAALSHRPCFLAGRRWAASFSPSADLVTPTTHPVGLQSEICCEIWDGHSAASLGRLVLRNEASYSISLTFDDR